MEEAELGPGAVTEPLAGEHRGGCRQLELGGRGPEKVSQSWCPFGGS